MITNILTILIVVPSIMAFQNQQLFEQLKHYPYREKQTNEWYRWLTAGFIHGGWLHLMINAFVLYSFGQAVEGAYGAFFGDRGTIYFILLFVVSVVSANIKTYFTNQDNPGFSSIGASGGVSGVLFAYILFYPWEMVYLYGVIGIPGIIAALGYLAYSQYMSKQGGDLIDHEAHLYGALAGLLLTILYAPMKIIPFFIERLTTFN